jgi:hypothetical protein
MSGMSRLSATDESRNPTQDEPVVRTADNAVMHETVTVTVGHTLGKAEAIRRIKDGLLRTSGHLGAMVLIDQESWEGDTLHLRIRALHQTATARVQVLEDALRIEVSLPWLLAKAANRFLSIIRKEATLLLEKK